MPLILKTSIDIDTCSKTRQLTLAGVNTALHNVLATGLRIGAYAVPRQHHWKLKSAKLREISSTCFGTGRVAFANLKEKSTKKGTRPGASVPISTFKDLAQPRPKEKLLRVHVGGRPLVHTSESVASTVSDFDTSNQSGTLAKILPEAHLALYLLSSCLESFLTASRNRHGRHVLAGRPMIT